MFENCSQNKNKKTVRYEGLGKIVIKKYYDERLTLFISFLFYFYKLLAACYQGYELGERLDTVEKARRLLLEISIFIQLSDTLSSS